MNDGSAGKGGDASLEVPKHPTRTPKKTPMYTASNAPRYQRQDLIKAINERENTTLICYVCGVDAEIDRNDQAGFVDLLHNIQEPSPIDLLLQTPGGDVDACEKLISVIHAKTGVSDFRVVVPEMAKSAGTLIALAANSIIMSDTSELGRIDPQFPMKDNQGNEFFHSVITYLENYKKHLEQLRQNPNDAAALLMLDRFDPKVARKFEDIETRVRTYAEDLLKRRGAAAFTIAGELLSARRWKTHGQPIGHADAKQFGLPVEYLRMDDDRWLQYWNLYCLQKIEIGEDRKLFESSLVSRLV